MNYQLKIRRFSGDAPHWQTFTTPCGGGDSVACALEELNSRTDLRTAGGEEARPVAWDCGCLEKKCGACAMVIGGKPRLACATALGDAADRAGIITLEPLKKFPCLADLRVDRTALFDGLREMELWLEGEGAAEGELHYRAASCLMCGLCLEVCPNFDLRGLFLGAPAAAAAFRLMDLEREDGRRQQLYGQYRQRFFAGCSKSLACQEICPAGVPVEQLLVKTNRGALWRRKRT